MKPKLPSLENVKNALESTEWDYGNQILYDLCEKNFEHEEVSKIIAKIWLIGRSYAAAIERRKKESEELLNDDFYINMVAPTIASSDIDRHLLALKEISKVSIESLPTILSVHHYFTQTLYQITKSSKRSLVSKYLHFHLPELFFIYDSRAVTSLRRYDIKMPKGLSHSAVDYDYSVFCYKCLYLKTAIENAYMIKLSNRDLDKILLNLV